jgi:hypothetical protein
MGCRKLLSTLRFPKTQQTVMKNAAAGGSWPFSGIGSVWQNVRFRGEAAAQHRRRDCLFRVDLRFSWTVTP